MSYGVKFLESTTQLMGKRYGELKGRMDVVEYACKYQSKARSDISAYVRSYLERHERKKMKEKRTIKPYAPLPVTSNNQLLLAIEDNESKLQETAEAIAEQMYDMNELRRDARVELEKLEERYRNCLPSVATMNGQQSGDQQHQQPQQQQQQSQQQSSSSIGHSTGPIDMHGVNHHLHPSHHHYHNQRKSPSPAVTFALKMSIAESKRTVALATAKLNSLKHQVCINQPINQSIHLYLSICYKLTAAHLPIISKCARRPRQLASNLSEIDNFCLLFFLSSLPFFILST